MMFLELHDEHRMGHKLLSSADLGIAGSSHQTHIGLSQKTLSFLPDGDKTIEDCLFIYENSSELLDAHFGKIKTPDGTYRSPKIRTGDKNYVSVVSVIREIVKNHQSDKWFLIWIGLKNEKILFFLFNEESNDYDYISDLGLNLDSHKMGVLSNSIQFNPVIKYLETKLDGERISIVEELKSLEVAAQVETQLEKRFQGYDIEKANKNFKEIGKMGEELVNIFLKNQIKRGEILNYVWYNESKESGLPYDFHIENIGGNIAYLDVKTTSYNFEQKLIMSHQEVEFISESTYEYYIYRVYKKGEQTFSLRICDNCKEIALKINDLTGEYKKDLAQIKTDLRSAKFAISPTIEYFKFEQEIAL